MSSLVDYSHAPRRTPLMWGIALGLVVTLVGCSSGGSQEQASVPSAPMASNATPVTEQGVVNMTNGWAKAADSAMTAVFGTLENKGDQAIVLESITTVRVAQRAELHETVMDQVSGSTRMQRVEGGFTIEPGQSRALQPGGDHIMLLDLQCALKAGNDVSVDLHFADGRTQVITVPVRDFAGAKEEYVPGDESTASHQPSVQPARSSAPLEECHE